MGLSRSYVSRVENGHAAPRIEMLEKWVGVLAVPLCQLFYERKEPPLFPNLPGHLSADQISMGGHGKVIPRSKRTRSDRTS